MASVRQKSYQTKSGQRSSWIVEWRDQNGRARSKSYEKKRDAKTKQREVEGLQDAGDATAVEERWTVEAWLTDYRERAARSGVGGKQPIGTSRKQQFGWFAKRINALIGNQKLDEITEAGMHRFRDDLLETGLDRKSAREILNHLKAALDDAKRKRLVLHNAWSDVKIVADTTPKPVRAPTREDDENEDDGDDKLEMPTRTQMRHLLATAKRLRDDPAIALGWNPDPEAEWRKHYQSHGPRGWNIAAAAWRRGYLIVLLAALTGLRQGEIRALYKRDVYLDEGLIRVRRAADKQNNIKKTKSRAGRRRVPIPPELAEELRAWMADAPDGPLMVPTRTGRIMDRSNVYHKIWRKLLEHAGMSDCGLSFHSLRHYYASSIIAAGLGPLDVKVTMGHKKISTTYDLYSELFPEDDSHRQDAAAAATKALLSE